MKHLIPTFALFFCVCNVTFSCMWDYDTYAMEKEQFPSIEELMVGNFLRHSPEYHKWRITDREQRLKQYPDSVQFYDDLAVSYSKLGEDEIAIKLMFKKETIKSHMYETYANLGTFYIHNKQLKKGIEYIDKAIEINPDAHFGREIYQRYVAEYVLLKMKEGKISLPLSMNSSLFHESSSNKLAPNNFSDFLFNKLGYKDSVNIRSLPEIEVRKAVEGVTGMMRFGNYDSPVLLEVLSDLLLYNNVETAGGAFSEGAKHLASMALLLAGRKQSAEIRNLYDEKAKEIIYYQKIDGIHDDSDKKMAYLKKILKEGIGEAKENYEKLRGNEMNWISTDKNVDLEYAEVYYTHSNIKSPSENYLYASNYTFLYWIAGGLIFLFIAVWILIKYKMK